MEASPTSVRQKTGSDLVAPDCRGTNFYRADRAFRDLLGVYMEPALQVHLEPHYDRLGELAGGRLDELADLADKHPPVLHPRDRFGRDEEWIEYHPAYHEMERIAFVELGLHAMSHRAGVLGWPEPMPPIAKYGFQYLFVQAEFGLMCPVSVSDTSNYVIARYGSDQLKRELLPRLLSQDPATMWKGTQFMTEKSGGSDVGALESVARVENGEWRLYGEKWFCSHADADLALILARPEGAPAGTRGLGLFAMPRRLADGRRNRYRVVRLKDKLGTRSMASGEIRLEGAFAWQVGELRNGFKQMLDQVNLSRLSHGVRAAAMMRRCLNEALCVARKRTAFGRALIEMPLMRRQLLKLMVPTEQALSMYAWTADVMGRANRGEEGAAHLLRILTPLYKFRACRDNLRVATGAMEVRGGNGYIEDWVNARLVRDAQIGVLWEGTSNINALDAIGRAAARMRAHETLGEALRARLDDAPRLPRQYRTRLAELVARAVAFAAEASNGQNEKLARMAAGALYNVGSAVLMAWEAAKLNNGRRLLLSRMVVEHRLSPQDPLAPPSEAWEERATALLLGDSEVTLDDAAALMA
ncbi:MAG TPA: acyl-CoA dehydrogenase family protein [Candidatus Binataceae bacterium]|nr:acyl-CoA dehydrogenase family protein [Candidatus Binataceae bacterium]